MVDHPVAHIPHFTPRHRRMGCDKLRRLPLNSVRGFANDFNVADHSVLRLRISLEGFPARQRFKIASRAGNRFKNVLQIIFNTFRMLHRGCACCKTLFRNFIGKSLGVKTDTCTPNSCCASCSKPVRVNSVVEDVASTKRSRSLSSSSLPVNTEPYTRGCVTL